ncbi:MAG: radical SAM protein, partial [Candidatus Cryptobacteroides sp.]
RDRYMPGAKVSVLSNATRCCFPEIAAALRKVDNPILKIDAPSAELAALVNRPVGVYDPRRTVEALGQFHGDFILQTMFLRSENFDTASENVLKPWMDIVRQLRPRQVMVYSLDRETPQKGLVKYAPEVMQKLVKPLTDEGINITFA